MILKLLIPLTLFITSSLAQAQQVTVQRALESSYSEYQSYLQSTQKQSYVETYTRLNEKREVTSGNVEDCLMDLLQESKDSPRCDKAIFELTRHPLNNMSSEVLASLLSRIGKSNLKEKQFFNSFLNSLLNSRPEIRKNLGITKRADILVVNSISKMEYQAWIKMLLKKVSNKEVLLLVNGKAVASLKSFHPPQGVFQWSLVTNSFEALNFVGTWHQFASRSSRDLKPFFSGTCDSLLKSEIQETEIIGIEVFLNKKCVQQSENIFHTKPNYAHLNDFSAGQSSANFEKSKWVWPSVFVAAGLALLANGMKNKRVRVEMPGAH